MERSLKTVLRILISVGGLLFLMANNDDGCLSLSSPDEDAVCGVEEQWSVCQPEARCSAGNKFNNAAACFSKCPGFTGRCSDAGLCVYRKN